LSYVREWTLLPTNYTALQSTPQVIYLLNRHHPCTCSASVLNSFALTVCLEVFLQQNFQIDNWQKLAVSLLHQPQYKSRQDAEFETNNSQ